VKLLDGQVAEASVEQPDYVFRLTNSGEGRTTLAADTRSQLECCEQSGSFGGPDAREAQQLGRRTRRQPAQRSVRHVQETGGNGGNRFADTPGAQQDGKQLRTCECCRTHAPQALAGAFGGCSNGSCRHS